MKTLSRLYILLIILIGTILIFLLIWKLNSNRRLDLFLHTVHSSNARMAQNILDLDQKVFMRPLRDNSEWDKTVQYVNHPTRSHEEECFYSLFETFSFNHIWVFDAEGKQVFYGHDPFSGDLKTFLPAEKVVRYLTTQKPVVHFFLNRGKNIVELSAATIVPTEDVMHKTKPKGFMVFGRNWDPKVIRYLEEVTGSTILMTVNKHQDNSFTPEDFFTVIQHLTDLEGHSIAELSMTFPLTYFKEWENDTWVITIANVTIGLLVIVIIGLLARVWLVRPLKSIIRALNTGDHRYIESLRNASNELGEMARLIEDSILIKNALNEEIKTRKETEIILSQLKEKAEESDRLKTAFLSNMSHEIRTPMNCILGFIQLLDQEDYTAEERRQYMAMVTSSGNQLLTIINDILDIARIESNQMIIQPAQFDLNQLMDKLYLFFSNELKRNKKQAVSLELVKGSQDGISRFFCDPARLEQILANLLSNAMKFTYQGKITFGYTIVSNQTRFSVKDTGVGISSENQTVVFERFRQEEETQVRNFRGTGLGLPISKGLVELMGGKMELYSEKGIGSEFIFEIPGIPLMQPASEEKMAVTDPVVLNLKDKTLLIAEDVSENIELISIMLKSTHVHILKACNGQEAVALCKDHPSIALVLMDIQMPVMDGYQATREIRQFNPDLPVIALTAYAFEKDKQRCKEAGCDDFISKPIQRKELLAKLAKFLN